MGQKIKKWWLQEEKKPGMYTHGENYLLVSIKATEENILQNNFICLNVLWKLAPEHSSSNNLFIMLFLHNLVIFLLS